MSVETSFLSDRDSKRVRDYLVENNLSYEYIQFWDKK